MNATSASAPRPIVVAKVTTPAITIRRLADLVAPLHHAGKGNWDKNDRIPIAAWFGAMAFVFVYLVLLPWLARNAGY